MNCLKLHAKLLFMFLLVSPTDLALGGIPNANVDLSPAIIFHNGDITTAPTPFPFLFLIAVVISIVTLVILVAVGKKLVNNNHRMNE